MIRVVRVTPEYIEYWDTVEKRIYTTPNYTTTINQSTAEISIKIVEDESTPTAAIVEDQSAVESAKEKEYISFDTMKLSELKAFAKEHNIKVPANAKKAEYVTILESYNEILQF